MSETNLSHITILKPRELDYTMSRITTDFIIGLEASIDRDKWRNRKEFFFQTLALCLSLPNLWRFPKEALTHGQAAFVWLYVIFMLAIGSCLLFFEIALGQYSSKGFSKVFAMCPLFEGISYGMAFYCATVSTYYNMLNVYSFIYLFASFNHTLEYASCTQFPKNVCDKNASNQSLSPESVYFYHRVVHYSTGNYSEEAIFSLPNWRNVGVLFFLWALVCIVILRGIRTTHWPAMVFCPLPYIILTCCLGLAFTLEGSGMGVRTMFFLNFKDLLTTKVWRKALEQTILSLGVGMGPLITLGSYSKFHSPADRDCVVLTICIIIGALLSGSILFASAGVLAHERNETMRVILKQQNFYPEDLSVYVIFSQLFTRLNSGVSHAASFAFFFMLLLAGWYSLITYTETCIVFCYTFYPPSHNHKIFTNLGICLLCFIFGALLPGCHGYVIFMSLDTHLPTMGLGIIIICELCAVIYIYGVNDFCDDVEFMLGFYPNLYCQTLWVFAPVLLLMLVGDFWYYPLTEKPSFYLKYTISFIMLIIVLPIILVGIYNIYRYYQMGDIRQVLAPREVLQLDDNEHQFPGKSARSISRLFHVNWKDSASSSYRPGPSSTKSLLIRTSQI